MRQNLTVVGLQWGDEGKGKVVDYVADDFAAVARYSGGSNAGHTVVIGKKRTSFHLVPSGVLKGKKLFIGAGVALDPAILAEELAMLRQKGINPDLTVDGRCGLVSPADRELDSVLEEMRGASSLGTTKRGVGPSYAMRAFRLAPRAADLVRGFDFGPVKEFYSRLGVKAPGLEKWARESKRVLGKMVGNVSLEVDKLNEEGRGVLFETSQGTLLDLLHGSYPYVTSSHTVASYVPAGVGIPPGSMGGALGVMKCYVTRVGNGPFPTELKGKRGDELRALGNEYGATTGRPRRTGWLDMVALRYTARLNGVKEVALSKVDVLAKVKEFKVCVAYRSGGSETADFQKALGALDSVEPVYESPLTLYGAEFGPALPRQASKLVEYVEGALKVKVRLVSYGDERSKTVEL